MTNFQQAANRDQQRLQQRLLLGLPIAVGAVLAALVLGFAVVPQWLALRGNRERIDRIEELEQSLPLLRDQLAKTSADQEQASSRRGQILTLIQGSGEFNTFLAQLDREARRNRVQLDLFEPVVASEPAAEDADSEDAAQEPLEAAGLSSQAILLTAQGSYPNLLAFMRAVERLSLLVVPSNFAIALVELPTPPGAPDRPATAPPPTTPQLKVQLKYYTPSPGNGTSADSAQTGESASPGDSEPET